jgi:hypothetical protein
VVPEHVDDGFGKDNSGKPFQSGPKSAGDREVTRAHEDVVLASGNFLCHESPRVRVELPVEVGNDSEFHEAA